MNAMPLTIELSPNQEARLSSAARQRGLDPAQYVKKLVDEYLPHATLGAQSIDPANDASIALLNSWLAEASNDPEDMRQAEEELIEFKRSMNKPRKEMGARLLFPEGGMSRTIFLDSGVLSLLTNPNRPQETRNAIQWAVAHMATGNLFIVPAIADYEGRRELERAGKTRGLAELDAWNNARPDRYLMLTERALRLGSRLWAQAHNTETPTADPKELDGDVLIAAQAIDFGLPVSDFVIATTNPGHLSLFAPADLWTNIIP